MKPVGSVGLLAAIVIVFNFKPLATPGLGIVGRDHLVVPVVLVVEPGLVSLTSHSQRASLAGADEVISLCHL